MARKPKEQTITLAEAFPAAPTDPVREPAAAPLPMTERRKTQFELEQEAGRKRVEHFKEQAAKVVQPKPDTREGGTVPVFVPGDHVPGMLSQVLKARSQDV